MELGEAHVWADVAEMWAIVAEIEGMKVANKEREADGKAYAYDEEAFFNKGDELRALGGRINGALKG